MNAVYHLALADFRERVRRFSFLVIIALAAFLGYQVIGGLFELRLGSYRGLLNAAWIGTLMALSLAFFLSLAGFYIVRGNVEQDRQTGVGQILAATPLSKLGYVLGKFGSNTAVLLVVVGVLGLASLAMLLIHGEDKTLDLAQLLLPLLVFAGPVALLVAATAVFFECTPVLRHSAGNVLFFFVWLFMVPAVGGDLLAFSVVEEGMTVALRAQGTDYQGGIVLGATGAAVMQTFLWTGFDWTAVAVTRLPYLAAALLLVGLAAVPFVRFDPARARPQSPRIARLGHDRFSQLGQMGRRGETAVVSPVTPGQLSPITAAAPLRRFAALVTAELKLLLKGRTFFWYAGVVGLILACLLAPLETTQRWLLPLAWLWPLLLWSEMGVRERRHRVDQLLFSAPAPLGWQLPAVWVAGVLLAIILGSGALLRFLAVPELLPGFMAGALFIPSLALLLGVVGGTERPLQILLLIFWYLGSLNGVAVFDITGASQTAVAQGVPWFYLALSPVLSGLIWLIRRRQIV